MKVNIALVFLGAVTASAIALPAQAATVNKTTSTSTIATSITGVDVGGTLYNIDFDKRAFTTVYAGLINTTPDDRNVLPLPGGTPDPTAAGDLQRFNLAKNLGNAILVALNAEGITQIFDATAGSNNLTQFYIPYTKNTNTGQTSENLVAICVVPGTVACTGQSFSNTDNLMYAKWTPATGNVPAAPTPALIPGLMGMGLAALRKKKQAAIVVQEA
jgi:hypothetical protein